MEKKKILSLALASTMALGLLSTAPVEARRFDKLNFRSFRTFRDYQATQTPEETPVVEEPVVEEPVVETPVVEEPTPEDDTQLGAAIDISADGLDVTEFGAVANADYYNPSNGNYYSDPSFTTPATDATDAINEAVKYAHENGIAKVYIPEGNYLIRAEGVRNHHMFEHAVNGGIQLESNMTLAMSNGTTLVTNTVNKPGYSLVTIDNKENVTVTGGKIVGDIDTHPANMHDYCYGITIANGSKNILIENVETTKAEDDGIMIVDYFPELSGGTRSSDIVIRNVNSHDNGRQGLTISTGSNIKVLNSKFSNQKKHMPMSGIDIELESYDFIGVDNIEIIGNTFEGNAERGVVLNSMFNDQPGSMSTNMKINDNTVRGSRFGITVQGKVNGLEVANNDIAIDHPYNESSFALSSESEETRNAVIKNNRVISNSQNYSIGVLTLSPSSVITGNTFNGQNKGVVVYTDNTTITNNVISNIRELEFEVLGQGHNISSNQVN